MQKSAKIALAASVLVVVVGAAAFWLLVLRAEAPERAQLPTRTDTTAPPAAADPEGDQAPTPEGEWVVVPGEGVFVGYRVQELFAGDTVERTAVGRSAAVEGTLTISGTTVDAVSVTVDMSALRSDSDRRDNELRTSGLQTDVHPQASFTLAEPLELGEVSPGGVVSVTAVGLLTLHGVTRPVQVPLEASWTGDILDVAGVTTVALADFGIVPPSNPFVKVADTGELELQLVFTRA